MGGQTQRGEGGGGPLQVPACEWLLVLTGELRFLEPLGAAEVVQVRVHVLVQQQPGLLLRGQGRVLQPARQQTAIACGDTGQHSMGQQYAGWTRI